MKENINLKLTKSNLKVLIEINEKTKIPITNIINIALSELNTDGVELLLNIENQELTTIKFRITESEKVFLKNEAIKSGANRIATEIKYRLLNSINKNKFFTSNELIEFIKTRYELNMIGRNLNQILKKLHLKNIVKIDTLEIKKSVDEINTNLKVLSKQLEQFIIHTNNRI